jgi:hypothetical protein
MKTLFLKVAHHHAAFLHVLLLLLLIGKKQKIPTRKGTS